MTAGGPLALVDFRAEFRAWVDANLPREWVTNEFSTNWPPGDDDAAATAISLGWHRRLHEGGWIAPAWPAEYGGRGIGLEEQIVIEEELASARAPTPIGFSGIGTLGPALIRFGTEEQRARFLPPILSADELWCQGYSEPGSGSDLASLRTRAVRDGDEYVVTGQKVWTSYGSRAHWCFLLVRTGTIEDRHKGITFLLANMETPGIEWRAIRQLTGDRHFGELFLEEARVPVDQRVGGEGEGWGIVTHSLAHERMMSGNGAAPVRARFDALRDLASRCDTTGGQRQSLARLETRVFVLAGLQARAIAMAQSDAPQFPAWASAMKVLASETRIEIAELAAEILGPAAMVAGPGMEGTASFANAGPAALWAYELLDAIAGPIYAGTNEIQRNIIAEVGLGLPR